MYREAVRICPDKNRNLSLDGVLTIPENAAGIVIFAHGSASGKNSVRNRVIANKLNENMIATLLFDLLSKEEQESDLRTEKIISQIPGATLNKFNIQLLSKRLILATDRIIQTEKTRNLPLAYYGSSTGAAAALSAASKHHVSSIVIRSGRTDLVKADILAEVSSPCLFIVGDSEEVVIKIIKQTIKKLKNVTDKKMKILEHTSHVVEESGSIEKIALLTYQWIQSHF